jgi:hypothetical protein
MLQTRIPGLAIRSPGSVCASLSQRAPPAGEDPRLFARWYLARVNLVRDMAGGPWCAISQYK